MWRLNLALMAKAVLWTNVCWVSTIFQILLGAGRRVRNKTDKALAIMKHIVK